MAEKKVLNLALQGGGSHGALTWGVLDRLLEEDDLHLGGFSGTSAGAMNATLLAYGLHKGDKALARELLAQFWKRVSEEASKSFLQPNLYDQLYGNGNMDHSPGYLGAEIANLFFSPYQTNPMDLNPLRDILEDMIDFDSLRNCTVTRIFLCATNVRSGRAKVFGLSDISVDAVLASACLPYLFKAVHIDGHDYWDGGYMGNPPIFPLIDGTPYPDILLLQINPINIDYTPTTAPDIKDRVNELSFNSSLMLEMRLIDLVDRLMKQGVDLGDHFRKIFIHLINPEKYVQDLNVSSKLNANWDFLMRLKNIGRQCAEDWLKVHYDDIGKRSTCDIRKTFL